MPISETANNITRGVSRLFVDQGMAPLFEFRLPNGRRNDVMCLSKDGRLWAIEVKSSREDFQSDSKWHEYLEWADYFLFAVTVDFPREFLPEEEGLILADRYQAEIVRPPKERLLATARRRSLTLSFARYAALRLQSLIDPGIVSGLTD